jgi:hypothetical protein
MLGTVYMVAWYYASALSNVAMYFLFHSQRFCKEKEVHGIRSRVENLISFEPKVALTKKTLCLLLLVSSGNFPSPLPEGTWLFALSPSPVASLPNTRLY